VTAWVPLRTGPEVARAPADGKIVSIARRAEAGQPFLAIEGQPPIAAPASGDVAATVKAGDTVRRGQVVGRIAETRARAELPASLRKRARAGVAVELRLADGSTRSAAIAAVVGSTVRLR
jgi:biotin carboxyl carrier protein